MKHCVIEIHRGLFDCRWNMATIYISLLMGFLSIFTVDAALQKNHFGKEFYIGMIASYSFIPDFQIDIASKENGNAYLDIPYLNIHHNQSFSKGNTTLAVNNNLMRKETFTENRGIHLSTDVPVAVYVSGVADTYLALPLSSLGTRYSVASYDPYSPDLNDESGMMIISAYDNTAVTIRDRSNRNSTISLDYLYAHQVTSQTDILNTAVWSDKPITVISGNSCAMVPHNISRFNSCNMLLEQMIPSSAWDNTFIVPPVFPKLGFILKVFSLKDHSYTRFCLTNSSQTLCSQPFEEEYLLGIEPVLITSNVSVNVVQYGVGQKYDDIVGDEFMTIVPGLNNYLNSYYFVIPHIYSTFVNRLSIVVPSTKVGGLCLDGVSLVPDKTYSVPDPFSNYSVLIINITVGYHELTHTDIDVMFGVTAYGLDDYMGYGFPVGFGLSIDNHPKSSTTASSTIYTPTSSSVSPVYIATNKPIENVTNVVCFSCDDLSHVELCDAVKHCEENEVCYIESFENSGRKLYRSGCLQSSTCQTEMNSFQHMPNRCVECCSHNYCNNQGCGDTGLPSREQRGPMCYDCPHEWSARDCNKVTLCEKDELCSIEELRWGEHSHFKMGCAYGQCTPSSRALHVVPRALPVCHSCCTDDYCNLNCTRSDAGSILVG